MLSTGDAEEALLTQLLPSNEIAILSTEAVTVGRGGNTESAFRHTLISEAGSHREVFHKVLKHPFLEYRTSTGERRRIPDPELSVARFVLGGNAIPIPMAKPIACNDRHLLYEFLPISTVEPDLATTLTFVRYAGRINSVPNRSAAEESGLQGELFFASRNSKDSIMDLLHDQVIQERLGPTALTNASNLYSDWMDDPRRVPSVFSHGDLHSHNASSRDGELVIYDWGSAGLYPVGFDLAEALTHARMHRVDVLNLPRLVDIYRGELNRCDVSREQILEGIRFGILKWLLPNHLRNIRRFSSSGNLRKMDQRTSISKACLEVAIECGVS